MNALVMDSANSVGTWISNLVSTIHRALVCSGRARAARSLAALGYYQEAKRLILDNQEDH